MQKINPTNPAPVLAALLLLVFTGCSKVQDKQSVFRDAVRANDAVHVNQMLEQGYIPRIDTAQMSALHEASGFGHLEIVKILISEGEKTNQRNNQGMTPLHMACVSMQSNADIVKMLLEHGADPTIKDDFGNTALDYALKYGYNERTKELNEHNQSSHTTPASAPR